MAGGVNVGIAGGLLVGVVSDADALGVVAGVLSVGEVLINILKENK
jgi:hypothetical protein